MNADKYISLFFREKPYKILLVVGSQGNTYISQVSKITDCTYAHTENIINQLVELGLINSSKTGRKRNINLTQLGKEMYSFLNGIENRLKELEEGGFNDGDSKG